MSETKDTCVGTEDAEFSTCGKCGKELSENPLTCKEQSIQCDCCEKFFHITCQSVTKGKLKAVSQFNLKWFCTYCDFAAVTIKTQCINLQKEQIKLKAEVESVNAKMTAYDGKLDSIEKNLTRNITTEVEKLQTQINNLKTTNIGQNYQKRVEELETGVSSIQEDMKKLDDVKTDVTELKDSVKSYKDVALTAASKPVTVMPLTPEEIKERKEKDEEDKLKEKKKRNLIFFNIPEGDHNDFDELRLADFYKIQRIYEDRVEIKEKDISNIVRLGKKVPDKVRPVLVTLKSEDQRMNILRNNKDLKLLEANKSTRIFVSTDKTPKEREEENQLRAELQRRKDEGEENLIIRNGKILLFRPPAHKSWANLFN